MLPDRLAISIVMIPAAAWIVATGGPAFLLMLVAMFAIAAREYVHMFRASQRPAEGLILVAVPLLVAARAYPGLNPGGGLITALIVAALGWHLIDFERGAPASATDFVITLGGIVYLGWLGGFFFDLRHMPDGLWWTMTTLSGIWLSDTGAYAVGRALGKHKLAPRLSPKKTWEGFAGGVLLGALGAGLLALFWQIGAGPGSLISWQTGLLLGAVVGVVGPIGDLGISMLKRQTGVKDAGALIVGHGGALDRIDSWLVAIPVCFYVILLMQFLRHSP
jgi:phosphatidate cytidylyltransferase